YVALRNTCAGLEISGPPVACTNTDMIYSVPAMAGATYTWGVPADWTIVSGSNTNVITVQPGFSAGEITIRQVNSCADLKDTIDVSTSPPTVAGITNGDKNVCEGINTTILSSSGAVGSVVNWVQSVNGTDWTALNVTGTRYNATNLTQTTYFAALLQNGATCSIDTAAPALITVDELSDAGSIQPTAVNVCLGETALPLLQLGDHTGSVLNWQQSFDNSGWANVNPANQQESYQLTGINSTRYFRAVVQNGVCAADTSDIATINYYNVQFPSATVDPDSSNICYGKSVLLHADISVGTSYTWSNPSVVTGGNGTVTAPYNFTTSASPKQSTNLVLAVLNAGCPNPYRDTVYIGVIPPVTVFAGNDTTVTVGQIMQFSATSNADEASRYNWSPGTGLNNTLIANPTGSYTNADQYTITYRVTVTTPDNCQGTDDITIKVFKTGADIFVPSAFTPNNDGKNDKIIPIAVGIKQIRYFRVYNRWGQLVFSTSETGSGWDGMIKGTLQPSSTFVFMVEGEDFNGKIVTKKGSFVLLR
ncbi:MAG: T9SS type B sorting domain-containing protein, partial [Flavitalea sp.]